MLPLDLQYQKALDYLYGFVDHSLTRQLRFSPEKFDLDRMHKLMNMLGNPHLQFPVVHIAGTKGKGSTAAMIASMLQASGRKIGLYTSPHLHDFCERIQVDRQALSHSKFVELVETLKEFVDNVPGITTFELTTAIAFLAFAEENVDIAVIEVGLGGRLDATNVVDPVVSVITSISFDHMDILGNTIALIAAEKAGIIKPGKPVIVGFQEPEAYQVIQEVCGKMKAPLFRVDKLVSIESVSHDLAGQKFQVSMSPINNKSSVNNLYHGQASTKEYWIPLLGNHQLENAATAMTTIQLLKAFGFSVSDEEIKAGFENLIWPGRFEILQKKPLIIVDAAHNMNSALRLANTVQDYLQGQEITMIFGSSEDKDVYGMYQNLIPVVKNLIVTQSTHPRAMEVDKLVELANQFGVKAIPADTVENAVTTAKKMAGNDGTILATGSIFIVAAVRENLMNSTE